MEHQKTIGLFLSAKIGLEAVLKADLTVMNYVIKLMRVVFLDVTLLGQLLTAGIGA